MGNQHSETQTDDWLLQYKQQEKKFNGTVVWDSKSQTNYYMKEYCYADQKEFERQLIHFQAQQEQGENVLQMVKVLSKEFKNFCSNTYKIYTIYEYPSVTLEEEINARKEQQKYFDETQLWAILHSCVNALVGIKPTISLHPGLVYILPDGVLKLIANQMVMEEYRCVIDHTVYYAPEKIQNFHQSDHEYNLRKQCIFGLGMSILHAALLKPLNDCYNYDKNQFYENILETHISQIIQRYNEQFIQTLAMMLEPNPERRISLLQIKDILNQVWGSELELGVSHSRISQMNEKNENKIEEENERISPNYATGKVEDISQRQVEDKENLFTDPKLLQMIRKDLQTMGKLQETTPQSRQSLQVDVKKQSQFSIKVQNDGKTYEGEMVDGVRHGKGKLSYPDGAFFEGDFQNGLMHGFGVLYYNINQPAYDGEWKNDQFHGVGALFNENPIPLNGDFNYHDFNFIEDFWVEYQGYFQNDNKEGCGKLLLSNGEWFEGEFHKDLINGQGRFYTKNGDVVEGTWQNNIFIGEKK